MEKIEEAVEKAKVSVSRLKPAAPSRFFFFFARLTLLPPLAEEEHQESARDGQASPPLQGEYWVSCRCRHTVYGYKQKEVKHGLRLSAAPPS